MTLEQNDRHGLLPASRAHLAFTARVPVALRRTPSATLVFIMCLHVLVASAAEAPAGGPPGPDCSVFFALHDLSSAARQELYAACLNAPDRGRGFHGLSALVFEDPTLISALSHVTPSPAGGERAFRDLTKHFRIPPEGSPAVCQSLGRHFDDLSVEALRAALAERAAQDRCLGGLGAQLGERDLLLLRVPPQEQSTKYLVLGPADDGSVVLEELSPTPLPELLLYGEPRTGPTRFRKGREPQVAILAVPPGRRLLIVAQRAAAQPSLVWRVRGGQDELLDLQREPRTYETTIQVSAKPGDIIFLNGLRIESGHALTTTLREEAAFNRLVVVRPSGLGRRVVDLELPRAARLAYDFARPALQVGVLPIVAEQCHEHGVNEASIKRRLAHFLRESAIHYQDLGVFSQGAKRLVEEVREASTAHVPAAASARGPLDPLHVLSGSARLLLDRSFSSLLDVRIGCVVSPQGTKLFSVTATKIDLERLGEQLAERDSAAPEPYFETQTFAVGEPGMLREGLVVPIAQLFRKPFVHFLHVPKRVSLQDDIHVELQSQRVPSVSVHMAPLSQLACDDLERANTLSAEAPAANGGAPVSVVSQRVVVADGVSKAVDLSVNQPGNYRVQLEGEPGLTGDRGAYRCVHVAESNFEIEGTYFFQSLWSNEWSFDPRWNPDRRPEASVHRYLLLHVGPNYWLKPAVGVWATRRRGNSPGSWADLEARPSAKDDGSISYVFERYSIMAGLSAAARQRLSRSFSLEERMYAMPRIEFLRYNRVPERLEDFSGRASGNNERVGVDLSLAAVLGIRWEVTKNIPLNLSLAVAVPKVFDAWPNALLDDSTLGQVRYEPTLPVLSIGLGGGYAWWD